MLSTEVETNGGQGPSVWDLRSNEGLGTDCWTIVTFLEGTGDKLRNSRCEFLTREYDEEQSSMTLSGHCCSNVNWLFRNKTCWKLGLAHAEI